MILIQPSKLFKILKQKYKINKKDNKLKSYIVYVYKKQTI